MTPGTEHAEGGGVLEKPAEFKVNTFHPLLKELRMACEKTNQWSLIKPIIDRLGMKVDGYFDSLDTA